MAVSLPIAVALSGMQKEEEYKNLLLNCRRFFMPTEAVVDFFPKPLSSVAHFQQTISWLNCAKT